MRLDEFLYLAKPAITAITVVLATGGTWMLKTTLDNFLSLRRARHDRDARALLDAERIFCDTLGREMRFARMPVVGWPGNIEVYLCQAVANVADAAQSYAALLPSHRARRFRKAWYDLVAFAGQKHPYQKYKTAKWHPEWGPCEDPAEILLSHIKNLFKLAGQTWLAPEIGRIA